MHFKITNYEKATGSLVTGIIDLYGEKFSYQCERTSHKSIIQFAVPARSREVIPLFFAEASGDMCVDT